MISMKENYNTKENLDKQIYHVQGYINSILERCWFLKKKDVGSSQISLQI